MLYRGLLATQLSGSIDGLVAAHNSGGSYFRNRTTPTNPNTSRQILMRSAVAAAYLNWLDLSPEQRGAWESYARSITRVNRIGATRHNSGWNEFIRAYTFRKYAESQLPSGVTTTLATIELPQVAQSAPYTAAITTANTDFNFTFDTADPWYADDQSVLLIEISGVRTAPGVISLTPYPPTRNFFKGPWQLAGVARGANDSSPRTITLAATPTQFQRVFWRARISSLTRGLGPIQFGVAIAP